MIPHVSEVATMVNRVLTEGLSRTPTCEPPETAHLGNYFVDNQPEKLRLSYGSDCPRRMWYADNEPSKAAEKDGWTRLTVFSPGFVWETYAEQILKEGLRGTPYGWHEPVAQAEVEIDGIKGHPDGGLTFECKPCVLLDFKSTTEFQHRQWEKGRMPDSMWGYPQQGGLYTMALEEEFPAHGFIWPCLIKPDRANGFTPRVEVGWMTQEEALEIGRNALATMVDVRERGSDAVPPRHRNYPKSPCGTGKKAYCSFFEWCKTDCR